MQRREEAAGQTGVPVHLLASGIEDRPTSQWESNRQRALREFAEFEKKQKERKKGERRQELQQLRRELRDGLDRRPVAVAQGRAGRVELRNRSLDGWEIDRRKLTVREFRGAVRAGGFRSVHLEARGPFFFVEAEPHAEVRKGEIPEESRMLLVTARDRKQHLFHNPGSALAMLWGMGVRKVEVHMEDWQPEETEIFSRKRPDLADRLRFAHEYARDESEGTGEGS